MEVYWKNQAPIVLNQPWQLTFKEGRPEIPKPKTLNKLQPWTNFTEDSSTQSFSGIGVYTTSFKLKKKADDFVLKFDKLYESAKVIINGQDAGIVWSLPYEINVGKYLKKGKLPFRLKFPTWWPTESVIWIKIKFNGEITTKLIL